MSLESPQRERPGPVLRMLLPMIRWLWPRVGTPLHVRLYRLLGGRLVGGGVRVRGAVSSRVDAEVLSACGVVGGGRAAV